MSESGAGAEGATWVRQVEEVVTGMRDWRTAHPRATFAELEVAVEERLSGLRASLLAEAALTATAAASVAERPRCAACGGSLTVRDTPERTLRIRGEQPVRLTRPYLTCTTCGRGVFPPG